MAAVEELWTPNQFADKADFLLDEVGNSHQAEFATRIAPDSPYLSLGHLIVRNEAGEYYYSHLQKSQGDPTFSIWWMRDEPLMAATPTHYNGKPDFSIPVPLRRNVLATVTGAFRHAVPFRPGIDVVVVPFGEGVDEVRELDLKTRLLDVISFGTYIRREL